jgi:putative transposase
MAKTNHYYVKFEPDCLYHVYNRAIDKKNMFVSPDNYTFFLKQYDKYLSPVVTTLSYGLMGNHFHFGIRLNSAEDLTTFLKLSNLNAERYNTPHAIVSHQFQLLFQSYAMAFNKQQGRTGTLLQRPFKRCAVDPDHITRLIFYHHLNPQKHKLVKDFRSYPWTSYSRYLSDHPSKLPRAEVFELFGGRENFIRLHQSVQKDLEGVDWMIE